VATGSPTSATIAPGQSATFTLSIAGVDGFNQPVYFSCGGVPNANCTSAPSPVTVGSSVTNFTLTVTTTAPSASGPRSDPFRPFSPGLGRLLTAALALAAMAWAIGRRNQQGGVTRWQLAMVPLALGLLLTLALSGCGSGGGGVAGGGGGVITPPSGTPPGTYSLDVQGTITAGEDTLNHDVTLTLNVT
jgi:hypothetical protein